MPDNPTLETELVDRYKAASKVLKRDMTTVIENVFHVFEEPVEALNSIKAGLATDPNNAINWMMNEPTIFGEYAPDTERAVADFKHGAAHYAASKIAFDAALFDILENGFPVPETDFKITRVPRNKTTEPGV